MTPKEVRDAIRAALDAAFQPSDAPIEGVRLRTPFTYPDGDVIDIFILERGAHYVVTDFGEALGWLKTQTSTGTLSAGQRHLLDGIAQSMGIEINQGQAELTCDTTGELSDAVYAISQAAVRITDLNIMFKHHTPKLIAEEVSEWLVQQDLPHQRRIRAQGRSGDEWTVDFAVDAEQSRSLVFLLSTASRSAAKQRVEHTVAACYDLSRVPMAEQQGSLITLFDDSADIWRESDLDLLSDLATPLFWSNRDEVRDTLRRTTSSP